LSIVIFLYYFSPFLFFRVIYVLDGRLVLDNFDFDRDGGISLSVVANNVEGVNAFLESFYGVAPVQVKPRKYNSWVYSVDGKHIRYIQNGTLRVEIDNVSFEDRERLTGLVRKVA